jgi:signal transduction histidine kinase
MLAYGRLLGSLNLGAGSRESFTEEILEHARELSAQLAVAIEQERLQKQIDEHAAELERTVAERTRELTEANAALDTFSYSVSHDLRAPLRTMQGFTQALLEDHAAQLDPVGQDYARRVAQAAERLDHLIQDLLQYSRLSQSKIDLQIVDLSTIVKHEILPDLAADLERQRAEVTIEEPLPHVLGHPATLSQVMSNLINNALKFVTPGKKPEVRVRADSSANGTVRIWVEDNGIGIAANHQDRIFQIFERLHASYPGTGTGLAIVRKGVERMGGQVGVVSQPGSGSRFWVDLPRPVKV